MLISSYFTPTIANAPCPPFFVENVYDIFISTAVNTSLSATEYGAVWSKCVEQFPQLATTPTTTTTTEQTTTSTTPTTTTTTEQTTTSTTPTTTTTTEQTTTSTTPTTTTTTEQTTTSTTPATTTTTEQTTTSTTPTTTTTTEQTTSSTTPTTTSTTEQTTTSTTPTTTTSATTLSTTTTTNQTPTPTSLTFSVTTEIKNVTTDVSTDAASLTQCGGYCLMGSIMFSVCVLVAVIAVAMACYNAKRKRKLKIKHNILDIRKEKVTGRKYIRKFPKIIRQSNFSSLPLAFENPTFIGHNGYIPDPYTMSTKQHHHSAYTPEINHRYKSHLDENHSNYQVLMYTGQSFNELDVWKSPSSESIGFGYSKNRPSNGRSSNTHNRHSSIGSHVPKVLLQRENENDLGTLTYGTYAGLPKIDIDRHKNDIEIPDYPGSHGLSRIDFVHHENDIEIPDYPGSHGLPKTDIDYRENDIEIPDYPGSHGLPRIDINHRVNDIEIPDYPGSHGLSKIDIDHRENDIEIPDYPRGHGLPRIPSKENTNHSENDSDIERFHLRELQVGDNQRTSNTVESAVTHGFPRIPIDSIEHNDRVNVRPERNGFPRIETKETDSSLGLGNNKKDDVLPRTPFQETRDSKIFDISARHRGLPSTILELPKSNMVTSKANLLYNGHNELNLPSMHAGDTYAGSYSNTHSFSSYRAPTYVTRL